jgi:hypothetical protein
MTHAEPHSNLRARTQTPDPTPGTPTTSTNGSSRRPLRLVHDAAQTGRRPHQRPVEAPNLGGHMGAVKAAVGSHAVGSTHPPTVIEAAGDLWPSRDDVRHGLAGQVTAAVVGLVQVVGLAICWGAAHGLFATKTRTAATALAVLSAVLAYAIASLA